MQHGQWINVKNESSELLERVRAKTVSEFIDLLQSLQNQPLQFCDSDGKVTYVRSNADFEQRVSKRDGWSLMLPDLPPGDEAFLGASPQQRSSRRFA